jgi:membrane protein DedA with SNARE-associated domain
MRLILGFVVKHGYALLFGVVFAEQVGLPVPAVPYLLAVGALSANGVLSFRVSLALGALASLVADLIWYEVGRRKGTSVLRLLCRIAIEPDSCVRQTEILFERHGAWSLLYSKFVPGLGTVAPPLAGAVRMPLSRFVAMDLAGALLWIGAYAGVGFLFAEQLEIVLQYLRHLGIGFSVLLVMGISLWVAIKFRQRRKILNDLRVARVTPEDLKRMLDGGEPVTIVDLRRAPASEAERVKLPGALRILPEQLSQRGHEIPARGEIILYCT